MEHHYVTGCRFSPDGSRILSESSDRTLIWDLATRSAVTLVSGEQIGGHIFSPDSRYLVSANGSTWLSVWETKSGTLIAEYFHGSSCPKISWSPVGDRLLVGCSDGSLHLIHIENARKTGGPMAATTNTFRVFVSSTFADMRRERRLLQESVFPRVEEYCRSRGVLFQAVDLRWGISEELQLRHKTIDLCLDEIARCQELSPKPNFIVLVGDRYGWQPVPNKIPRAEMEELYRRVSEADRRLIDFWFRRDDNAIPPEYVLQPRGSEYRHYADWLPIETALLSALRRAVRASGIADSQQQKYFASATHLEVLRGLFDPPPSAAFKPEEHVFAYVRQIPRPAGEDRTGEESEDAGAQLDKLKSMLKATLDATGHYREYAAKRVEGEAVLDSPREFCDRVYRDLVETIDDRLMSAPQIDELTREIKSHQNYKDTLCSGTTGRRDILDRIREYLRGDDSRVLWLTGESGIGKSSILAKLVDELETAGARVHYRFVGATAKASSTDSLLESLAEEIGNRVGHRERLKPPASPGSTTVSERLQSLLSLCAQLATLDEPVAIVLDGLDEQAVSKEGSAPNWVPAELPRHVRMVVSSASSPTQCCGIIEAVPRMTREEGEQVVEHWLEIERRRLTDQQREKLLDAFDGSGLPLYLRLVFPKVKNAHSYDGDLSLASDIGGAVDSFFEDLEHSHGRALVEKTMGYLVSGRYAGLAEAELLDVLVRDAEFWAEFIQSCDPAHRDEVAAAGRLPFFVWSRLRQDLESCLGEADSYGTGLLTLFHKATLIPSVVRRFTSPGGVTRWEHYHRSLAAYWGSQPLHWQSGQTTRPNLRKMTELPWQLVEAGDWPQTIACFSDPQFAGSCLEAGIWWEFFPVVMSAIAAARQQGEYAAANRISDLITGLIAFKQVKGGEVLPTAGQTVRLAEELDRTIKDAEELWFKRDPRALALANLGAELCREGRADEGRALLCEALDIDPDCELAHYNLGVDALDRRDADSASASFTEVLRINPHNRQARAAIDEIASRRSTLPVTNLLSPRDYVREAMVAVNLRGDIAGADRLLREGLDRYPDDVNLMRAIESLHRTFGMPPPSPAEHLRKPPDEPPRTATGRVADKAVGGGEGGGALQVGARTAGRRKSPGGRAESRHMPKVGKNDPCPCGSGKKYKKCHGAPV
jgi:tetratricopeptide (TPR) repeat protein